MDVLEEKAIGVAKRTLRMPDAIANVMGGPSKEEAVEILIRYGEIDKDNIEEDVQQIINERN